MTTGPRGRKAQTFMLDDRPHLLLPLRHPRDMKDLQDWAKEAQMPLEDLVYSVLCDAMARNYRVG